MGNYEWLRELLKGMTRDEVSELLPDTLWDIYDTCGPAVLFSLLENLPKVPIYIGPQTVDVAVLRPNFPRKKALAALPEKARYIYKRCGRAVLLALLNRLPGVELYIAPDGLKAARTRYVRSHFNGRNVPELALRLGVSTCHIYQIISAQNKPPCAPPAYTPRLPF
ncbi:MAG: Mor transcription activator family protein [Elusimicrobiales bacterium]